MNEERKAKREVLAAPVREILKHEEERNSVKGGSKEVERMAGESPGTQKKQRHAETE